MYRPLFLVGMLAAVGCAGSSAPPPTGAAISNPATDPKFAILVPNMT